MNGTILWNLCAAVFGFLFVSVISAQVTTFETAIFRGAIGFFSFFILSYMLRGLCRMITVSSFPKEGDHDSNQSESKLKVDAEETSKMVRRLLNEDS